MQEFLAKVDVNIAQQVDARKSPWSADEALLLVRQADKLYVARGKKVVRFDLKKDCPDEPTLLKHLLGPTGNLRAPALRIGNKLVIGFNRQMLADLFA